MATLTIESFPEALHEQLKIAAERDHRTVAEQVVSVLQSALVNDSIAGEMFPPPIKPRRPISPEEVVAMIRAARDAPIIIADANLLLYLAVESPMTSYAQKWEWKDPDWRVPSVWRYEFSNGLLNFIKTGAISPEEARQKMYEFSYRLVNKEVPVDQTDALRLALRHRLATYDANYLALAEELGARCVTNDQKMLERAPGLTIPLTRLD